MSERLQYAKQIEAQIANLKARLEELKVEKKEVMNTIQHEEVKNLEKYLDDAHVSLKGLAESADEAWQQLKEDLEKLMLTIGNSLKQLLGESDDSSER